MLPSNLASPALNGHSLTHTIALRARVNVYHQTCGLFSTRALPIFLPCNPLLKTLCAQVKELEVAAARAAHDGTLQIEAAVAEAASRTLTVAEVAELRGRLLEEQTAAANAIAARHATAVDPM